MKRKIMVLAVAFCLSGIVGCGQAEEDKSDQTAVVENTSGEEEDSSKEQAGESSTQGGDAMQETQGSDTVGESGLPQQMPAFTTRNLAGDEVTESIFAEKDLTVLNIWGTFCPPCIGEMPQLGQWAREMPENVQLLGLIVDIEGEDDTVHQELATEIMDRAGADFTQLIVNEDFASIVRWVVGVPTTLFVDSEGNLVGDPIVGADVDGYKAFVEEYLSE